MIAPASVAAALADGFLDLLFPASTFCPICQATARGPDRRGRICPTCWLRLAPPPAAVCGRCGRPHSDRAPECRDCRRSAPDFVVCRAVGAYEGALRDAIGRLKFRGERILAVPLGRLMAVRVADMLRRSGPPVAFAGGVPPTLVPVPLHATRWRERGYNQAEDLARQIGRTLGFPVAPRALRRKRLTRPQTGRTRRERLAGGADSLAADSWRGGIAILVDDVITTGSTLRDGARALTGAGAPAVFAVAAAATPMWRPPPPPVAGRV